MIEIGSWMELFLETLQAAFPQRLKFVGLQGSYGRGEARDGSDIDVVVIFDELCPEDLQRYGRVLDTLPHRELVCGFVSGWQELRNWEPSDLFQFYFDTTPVFGSLEPLRKMLDSEAVNRAIRIGACNLYHACVHNMLHEKDPELLRGLYKSAAFVVQALHYRRTGEYRKRKTELLEAAPDPERKILEAGMELKTGGEIDGAAFLNLSAALFSWARGLIV